ncbi:hypothetical protein ACFE04_030393 [Oxalis oulophora]
MASSQVEIAATSPFDCVLRDRNSGDLCASNATRVALRRNLKEFVKGHHLSGFDENENSSSQNQKMNAVDSWVSNEQHSAAAGCNRRVIRSLRLEKANIIRKDENCLDVESLAISPRHAKILDRWPAARGVPIVSSRKQQEKEAHDERTNQENEQNSSDPQREPCSDAMNLGASSLVQIWEARMKQSSSPENFNENGRTSSASSCNENENDNENENETIFSMSVEETSRRESEIGDISRISNIDDSFSVMDWDGPSDSTRTPCEPPLQGKNPDAAAEKERVHVSEIIRRLISENKQICENGFESSKEQHRPSSSAASDVSEHTEVLTQIVIRPKIRGRQAFADLLTQIQGDRNKELVSLVARQAVSKFSHRGRLQSMLKVRCLRRCAAIQDNYGLKQCAQIKQKPQGNAVMHLRERFKTCQSDTACLRSSKMDLSSSHDRSKPLVVSTNISPGECSVPQASVKSKKEASLSSNVTRPQKCTEPHEQASGSLNFKRPPRYEKFRKEVGSRSNVMEAQRTEVPASELGTSSKIVTLQTSRELETETSSSSNVRQRELPFQNTCRSSQEIGKKFLSLNETERINGNSLSIHIEEQEETSSGLNNLEYNGIVAEKAANEVRDFVINVQENVESVSSYTNWDENEIEEEYEEFDEQQYYVESGYDWFSEIARPQSYWEDLRKARYQEVLTTRSEDEEIRKLLERRTVSSFLSSDFRSRMDQLMMCRVQQQNYLDEYQEEDETEVNSEDRVRLLTSFLQHHLNPLGSSTNQQEEEQQHHEEAVQEAERNVVAQQMEDRAEEQIIEEEESEAMLDGEEASQYQEATSNYFDQSSSIHPSPYFYQDSQLSSNQPSTEMELIYNLRGHIEQLQSEMSELRKCMMSCMEMQAKMQQTIMQNFHSEKKSSINNAPPKRKCKVCYEMEVDSVLYRCGHMCTCLKCAQELQTSTGKCPICRAPIDDVVRVFTESYYLA